GVAVRTESVEFRLDETGAESGTSAFRGPGDFLVDQQRIRAINGRAWNAERGRFLGKRIARQRIRVFEADVCVGLIFVVLQDEYDGQFPDCREVERLEERPLFARSVSEEAVDDLPGVLHLSRQSGARGMSNALTDDG